MFFGNLFVYVQFEGKESIDGDTRRVVFIVLGVVAAVGIVFLAVLRPAKDATGNLAADKQQGPVKALTSSLRLFATKEMLLLSVTFFYTGENIKMYVDHRQNLTFSFCFRNRTWLSQWSLRNLSWSNRCLWRCSKTVSRLIRYLRGSGRSFR